MIYINTDASNTFNMYIGNSPAEKGEFLCVIENPTLRKIKKFKIIDNSQLITNKNTFTINITHIPIAENLLTPVLYLDNWLGYNYFKIYYSGGTVPNTLIMSESALIAEGIFNIYSNSICYTPRTGTTTLDYGFNLTCTGTTYI